jgi:hypothetical protein
MNSCITSAGVQNRRKVIMNALTNVLSSVETIAPNNRSKSCRNDMYSTGSLSISLQRWCPSFELTLLKHSLEGSGSVNLFARARGSMGSGSASMDSCSSNGFEHSTCLIAYQTDPPPRRRVSCPNSGRTLIDDRQMKRRNRAT